MKNQVTRTELYAVLAIVLITIVIALMNITDRIASVDDRVSFVEWNNMRQDEKLSRHNNIIYRMYDSIYEYEYHVARNILKDSFNILNEDMYFEDINGSKVTLFIGWTGDHSWSTFIVDINKKIITKL